MNKVKSIRKRGLALVLIIAVVSIYGCGSANEADDLLTTNKSNFKGTVSQKQDKATEEQAGGETEYEKEGYGSETDNEMNGLKEEMTTVATTTQQPVTEKETTAAKETTTDKATTAVTQTTTAKEMTTVKQTTTAVKQTTTARETTTAEQTTTVKETITQQTTTTTSATSAVSGAFKAFSVQTLDGYTLTQDIFSRADVNVVIIWTTWCGYCKLEMPALQKVMEKYAGESIQFFSLVCDVGTYASEDDAMYLIKQMGVTFPCMIYNDSMSDGYMEGLSSYPKTLYINRDGQIMYEVGGAYAGYGEDYAIECHSQYVDYFLAYPDYLPE